MPALDRAVRRVHVREPKVEGVTARDSRAIIASRRRPRRPIVSSVASVPESTSRYRQMDVPAAHEVKVYKFTRVLFSPLPGSLY